MKQSYLLKILLLTVVGCVAEKGSVHSALKVLKIAVEAMGESNSIVIQKQPTSKPFITLSYAQSLDGSM